MGPRAPEPHSGFKDGPRAGPRSDADPEARVYRRAHGLDTLGRERQSVRLVNEVMRRSRADGAELEELDRCFGSKAASACAEMNLPSNPLPSNKRLTRGYKTLNPGYTAIKTRVFLST